VALCASFSITTPKLSSSFPSKSSTVEYSSGVRSESTEISIFKRSISYSRTGGNLQSLYAASLAQLITALYNGSTGTIFPIHPLNAPFSVKVTNTPFGFFRFSETVCSIISKSGKSPFMEERAKSKSIFLSCSLSIKSNTCITNNPKLLSGYITRVFVT